MIVNFLKPQTHTAIALVIAEPEIAPFALSDRVQLRPLWDKSGKKPWTDHNYRQEEGEIQLGSK